MSETPERVERVFQTKDVEIPILITGPESGLDAMSETFRKNWKNLVFRKVSRVTAVDRDYLGTFITRPVQDGTLEVSHFGKDDTLPLFTKEENEQRVEKHYSKFFFFTTAESLRRETDKFVGEEIFCESSRYNQLDLFDKMNGKFSKKDDDKKCTVPPRPGDLVCILPFRSRKNKAPEAKYWFTCSEQFLKAWTLIVFPLHESCEKLGHGRQRIYSKEEIISHLARLNEIRKNSNITEEDFNAAIEEEEIEKRRSAERRLNEIREQLDSGEVTEEDVKTEMNALQKDLDEKWRYGFDEAVLRRKVFQGNHLMANSFRKWCLSCIHNNLSSTQEELDRRFWNLRTELASRWVNIYCCLVLMIRYREFPCEYNIPNIGGDGPFMKAWDLPEGWLERLIQKYNLLAEPYMRQIKVRVFPEDFVPKGTIKKEEEIFIPIQEE